MRSTFSSPWQDTCKPLRNGKSPCRTRSSSHQLVRDDKEVGFCGKDLRRSRPIRSDLHFENLPRFLGRDDIVRCTIEYDLKAGSLPGLARMVDKFRLAEESESAAVGRGTLTRQWSRPAPERASRHPLESPRPPNRRAIDTRVQLPNNRHRRYCLARNSGSWRDASERRIRVSLHQR